MLGLEQALETPNNWELFRFQNGLQIEALEYDSLAEMAPTKWAPKLTLVMSHELATEAADIVGSNLLKSLCRADEDDADKNDLDEDDEDTNMDLDVSMTGCVCFCLIVYGTMLIYSNSLQDAYI